MHFSTLVSTFALCFSPRVLGAPSTIILEPPTNELSHRNEMSKRSWYQAQGIDDDTSTAADSGTGTLQCDVDNRVGLDTSAFKALATKFCQDSNLDTSSSQNVTPADAGIQNYDGYTFSFKWEKSKGKCSSSCVDIFMAFTSSSVCSYDSHTKAASGSQKLTCGTASFNFSDGKSTQPVSNATTSEAVATSGTTDSGCQSPNHNAPRTSFKLAQSDKAVWMWNSANCLLNFSQDGTQGCTLYFNPCSKKHKERAVSVALTVTLLSQNPATPAFEDSRDTFHSIVSDCDTTTVDAKWGGWQIIERGNAKWMYNVTADQTGSYAPVSQKHKAVAVTSGPYCKKAWLSHR